MEQAKSFRRRSSPSTAERSPQAMTLIPLRGSSKIPNNLSNLTRQGCERLRSVYEARSSVLPLSKKNRGDQVLILRLPARSEPQVGIYRPTYDAVGAEPIRKRPYHVHAYRLDQLGDGGD